MSKHVIGTTRTDTRPSRLWRLEQTTGRRVLLGAAYTALDRLESRGLVSSRLGDPSPERGGRAKRYFDVTPRGLDAVKDTRRALENLWTGVPQLREKRS